MNNTSQIRQLLEKYFEGETSLTEEKELKTYFNGKDVEADLKPYQGLFQFFIKEKDIVFPEQEDISPIQLYKTATTTATKPTKVRQLYVKITRIAAVLLLAVCAYLLLPNAKVEQKQQAINWEQYEISDEDEAVEKTIAALRLVSAKLNGGAKRAVKEVHHVQAAAKIFKK